MRIKIVCIQHHNVPSTSSYVEPQPETIEITMGHLTSAETAQIDAFDNINLGISENPKRVQWHKLTVILYLQRAKHNDGCKIRQRVSQCFDRDTAE